MMDWSGSSTYVRARDDVDTLGSMTKFDPSQLHLQSFGGLDHRRMQRLLGYNLAQASIPTFAIFDREIGPPLELRQVEYTILVLVDSNSYVTQKKLSLALDIAAPNMTVILDRLVKRELIERTRSEEDRRIQFLKLTEKGRQLNEKACAIADRMEMDLLAHLSEAERAMLFELLQKVSLLRSTAKIAISR